MNANKFVIGQKVIATGQVVIKVVAIRSNGDIVCKNKHGVTGTFKPEELRAA